MQQALCRHFPLQWAYFVMTFKYHTVSQVTGGSEGSAGLAGPLVIDIGCNTVFRFLPLNSILTEALNVFQEN